MTRYITNLRMRGKFLLVAVAMLVPIAVLLFMLGRFEWQQIRIAKDENEGLQWAAQMLLLTSNLAEYREHAIAVAGGAESEREEMAEHRAAIMAAADQMDHFMAVGDEEFKVASHWAELGPRLRELLEGDPAAARQLRAGPSLIQDLHQSVLALSEVSGLILDPGADTYPLMASALFELPLGTEALASARRAMDMLAAGDVSITNHADLASRATEARVRLVTAMHWLVESYGDSNQIRSTIPSVTTEIRARLQKAFAAIESASRDGVDSAEALHMSGDIEVLSEDLVKLRVAVIDELSQLLVARARSNQWMLVGEGVLVLVCLLAAFWIQRKVTLYVSQQLDSANGVFAKLERGEFDSEIGEQPRDELGALLVALARMQGILAERVEQDRIVAQRDRERATASERIKQALDSSSVNVVVADEAFNIIYVNPAAQKLFLNAQSDFRQLQPRFDAQQLVGMSMDVFYADGARQREALAMLRQSSSDEYVVGSRILVATASPIVTSEGARIGTVVEWRERTQEVKTEQEIGALVAAVSDGRLDQRISLDGKSGFFEVLGRGLNGVVSTVNDVVAETGKLVKAANEGDLTLRMELDGRPGLFVSIGSGVNELVANMGAVVSEVKGMAFQVQAGAEEISKGNLDLSQRTEEQASSLEETASSMEEMTSTVKQTADNAGQANQLALAARQQAEKGGKVVSDAIQAMNGINEASRKIADIIGVIDEIAFQTNLLALNAAVEAARAGEQGRGFAVVATEVRNLAGRSATAAKEIKALIQDSVARVEAGSKLVDESGHTLDEIVSSVKKVTDVVAEIAAASREQSSGIEQVNKAVMAMDSTTQQNAALVEQAAAASRAIVEQTQALFTLLARYRVLAQTSLASEARGNRAARESRSAASAA